MAAKCPGCMTRRELFTCPRCKATVCMECWHSKACWNRSITHANRHDIESRGEKRERRRKRTPDPKLPFTAAQERT